jgi:hypothetical protein
MRLCLGIYAEYAARIWAAITVRLTMIKPMSAMNSELELGLESHISITNDDYYTPPYIFESLGLEFDMDVAAPVGGISWIPAKCYLTIADDGLTTNWDGLVWMNPPYSSPKDWIYKFVAHGNGLCLVPTSKAKWLKFIWENCDGAMVVEPNLKFIRGNGYAQIQYQTIMFSMGKVATDALKASGLGRVR